MKRFFKHGIAAATLVAAGAVQAQGYGSNQGFYVWADVVDVEPLVTTRYEQVPTRFCEKKHRSKHAHQRRASHHRGRDNRYRHDRSRHDDYRDYRQQNSFPALLGSVIGGAIGHQFGSGDGKRAMTVLGAIAGAEIARSSGKDRSRSRSREHVCETGYEVQEYEVIDGYQVTYSYLGRTFQQTTDADPGDQMRIYVTVDPVGQSHI